MVNSQLRRQSYISSAAPSGVPVALGGGVSAQVGSSSGDITGQLGLGILGGAVVALVLFYLWTRSVQGGG